MISSLAFAHPGMLHCDPFPRPAGLEVNPDRPDDKLPYPGAWLWIGPDMVHLMELPNPDPLEGRATVSGCKDGKGKESGMAVWQVPQL